ncbi:aminotransferase DegT [Flavipsychrobacter stenotrophus]|uniref:Aminotransferase DegT n=1 Tax=Flavipsychrobacter stenotrophus TaxID=2077091 RepID=A0A2S7SYP0_9BACT|nr:DegT/DnrJ/EryC1/StrS family aminotransferase [Flavipsychrobacter stenotrophus]PQJ11646.1 aminotransferase DegT [Flavipsychrobacter stenotrophus]
MINVTKPFLPPMEEYNSYVKGIWERNWLTNNGPLVNELELKLKEYLSVNHLLFLSNGTIALQIAIKALNLTGEIITTPFSYVATTSSIVWEGCEPVFVDIDRKSLNIDPKLIEAAITDKTTAILATHVYGNPCDVEAIDKIALKHNLKVIYDAAHAFAVTYKGRSVFEYGDISTTSFHATKVFHTTEGGAVFTKDSELLKRMSRLRNFGHVTPETFDGIGVNGKNSEFHAAMGLANLKYIDEILASRKEQVEKYKVALKNLRIATPEILSGAEWNYSYFPVIFETEDQLQKSIQELNLNWVYPRRYFYPSLSHLDYVNDCATPVSDDICKRVLCLPLYHSLRSEDIDFIARLLLRVQNN